MGYPESVYIDYDGRQADEERGFNITMLTADSLGNPAADQLAAARGWWATLKQFDDWRR